MNVGALKSNGDDWAARSAEERNLLELIAASPTTPAVDTPTSLLPFSPDLDIGDLPELVADGAIHPRAAATPEEQALVAKALSQPAPP